MSTNTNVLPLAIFLLLSNCAVSALAQDGKVESQEARCRHFGQLYVKNTSGTHVVVALNGANGSEVSKSIAPGQDTVVRGICISQSLIPPASKVINGEVRDRDGGRLRSVSVRFDRLLVYSAAAIVFDCAESSPCFQQISLPEAEPSAESDSEPCRGVADAEDGEDTGAAQRYFEVTKTDQGGFELVERTGPTVDAAESERQPTSLSESPHIVLNPECTTDSTSLSGARKSCSTPWEIVTAPPGYAFNKDTVNVQWRGRNGSENDYWIEWDNYVPVGGPSSPFTAPRTIRVRVHARSPRDRGARGWTKITVTAPIFALP